MEIEEAKERIEDVERSINEIVKFLIQQFPDAKETLRYLQR